MRSFVQAWLGEYKTMLCDRGVALIMVGSFLVYPFFYPLPYLSEVVKDVPLTVVDLDASQMSRRLIRMLDASELLATRYFRPDLETAKGDLFSGDSHGIIVIPRHFHRDSLRGEPTRLSLYSDVSNFIIHRQVVSGCLQVSGTLSAAIGIRSLQARGYNVNEAVHAGRPLPLAIADLFNATQGYAQYIVPAVFILLLQQTLLVGIGMLAGTIRDTSGTSQPSVVSTGAYDTIRAVMGKSCAYLSLYMMHTICLVCVMEVFYRFPRRGDLTDLFCFMLVFLTAVTFMGTALSYTFKRRETSLMILLFTSIIALFLSGITWPVEALPAWLRAVSLLIPTTAGIDGFLRINQMGATLQDVRFDCHILCLLSIAYFLATCLLNRLTSRRSASGGTP